jgi:hypothetical protein
MLIAGENVSGVGTSMSTVINGALSLVQSVFVPTADSEAVQKLRNALGTDRTASRVGVIPDPNAKESYCYQNVQSKVELKGGRMQLGWAVWQLLEPVYRGWVTCSLRPRQWQTVDRPYSELVVFNVVAESDRTENRCLEPKTKGVEECS